MSAPTGWLRVDELPDDAWRVVDTSGTVRPLTFTGPAARHLADVCALALNAAAEAGGPAALIDARDRWLPVAQSAPCAHRQTRTGGRMDLFCKRIAGHSGNHVHDRHPGGARYTIGRWVYGQGDDTTEATR